MALNSERDDVEGNFTTRTSESESYNADEVSTSTYYVFPSDDLSSRVTNGSPGTYILTPNSDGTTATYTLDDIPSDYHIQATSAGNVILQTSDPTTVPLTLYPHSSVADVTIKDASDPGGITAGDPRVIGEYANFRDSTAQSPQYWPGQGLQILTGETGTDNPAIAGITYGIGDGIYGYSAEGDAVRMVVPSSDNGGDDAWYAQIEGGGVLGRLNAAGELHVKDLLKIQSSDNSWRTVIDLTSTDELVYGKDVAQNATGTNHGRHTFWLGNGKEFQVFDSQDNETPFKYTAGGQFEHLSPWRQPSTDLTAAGAPAPTNADSFAVHDGTGTPPAGLYRSDTANNQWVKVEDNTTTIAY